MTPLEAMLSGECAPSQIIGPGYTGPEKPSDSSTLGYLALAIAAIVICWWVVIFK